MRIIKFIAVHCSATAPGATVDSIKTYWRDHLGWKSPGYHHIIDKTGAVHDLLSYDQVSNGVKGFNHELINVCYIGGIDEKGKPKDTRTFLQRESLFRLLSELKEQFPHAIIQGHRDFSQDLDGDGVIEMCEWIKSCPCFDAKNEYKSIR